MSTILREHQFELLPTLTAETGAVFGIGSSVSMNNEGWDPGDDEWEDQDESNPRRGGVNFGREVLNGPTWAFELHTNETDVSTARAALSAFKAAWRAPHIRQTPGAVIPIRYRLDDTYRRVYGRPRRFSAPPDNQILSGFIPITCDFQCVDALTYDDIDSVVQLSLAVGGSEGGFEFPVTFPTTTLPSGSNQAQLVVGGDAPTYPVITIEGPITSPVVETEDWLISLDMTIPEGSEVVIDLRPWAISVLQDGSISRAGKLGRRQYLADLKLTPGAHEVLFRGASEVTAATCTVRWANAHSSI